VIVIALDEIACYIEVVVRIYIGGNESKGKTLSEICDLGGDGDKK